MKLSSYLNSLSKPQQLSFAARCGCSLGFLRNVAGAYPRNASAEIALAIERESGGLVTVAEVRPSFAEDLKRSGYQRMESLQNGTYA